MPASTADQPYYVDFKSQTCPKVETHMDKKLKNPNAMLPVSRHPCLDDTLSVNSPSPVNKAERQLFNGLRPLQVANSKRKGGHTPESDLSTVENISGSSSNASSPVYSNFRDRVPFATRSDLPDYNKHLKKPVVKKEFDQRCASQVPLVPYPIPAISPQMMRSWFHR